MRYFAALCGKEPFDQIYKLSNMKNKYILILFFTLFVSSLMLVPEKADAQCTMNNIYYRHSSSIYSPGIGNWIGYTGYAGYWRRYYLYGSYITQFHTCNASFDTQLTVYGATTSSSGYSLAYSDDAS